MSDDKLLLDIETCSGIRVTVGGKEKYRELSDDEITRIFEALENRREQQQAINELKAHVERLRDAALKMDEESVWRGDYLCLHFDKDGMDKALAETPAQSLNIIKAQVIEHLQKENDELKAHIERLRGALGDMIKAFMPPEGSGAGSRGVDDVTVAACIVLAETRDEQS